ncbi:serine hydrolase [Hwangdonia lutea]|uniref:Serine hydrolase n=1 Tax=Hwangdonia lutea TaxID=3075823 RepID=A0AA97EML5_9FLAO|nr:serine hydrolase [Hwangdonia sp. SCSIO 19198]WOD43219.1 serine hydrolase [Hwangdonia sp. SCSIO 19198]
MKNNKNNSNLKPSKKKSHPFWSFFWLTFLVISLWYAWYSFYAPSNNIAWINDIESAQKLANNSDKNIMIFFTGKWCSPCKIMKRQVFADTKVMKAINSNIVPIEIDIDDPNNKELVKHFNIGATPTTIFINPEGKVMDYAVGKVDKSNFLQMLHKISAQEIDNSRKRSDATQMRKRQLEQEIIGKVKFLDEPENFSTLSNSMINYNIPGLSLAVINNGKIEWSHTYTNPNFPDQKLNDTTIFQAASLSKPVTFLAALRMHTAVTIDLDKNIENYLKSFNLPQGKQTVNNPVTFRNIFAHTSGITSGGYQGYARDLNVPTDVEILKGAIGVNSQPIAVLSKPNDVLAYSGGGYTLAEVALQDIHNDTFSNLMKTWILDPVGMNHSEFTQPLIVKDSSKIAKGHTQSGKVLDGGWRNHPEQAAAGLWSTSFDLAKFLIEIYKAYQGKNSVFSASAIKSIINEERDGHIYGFIVDRSNNGLALTHYGGNAGYRTGMTIDLTTGKGLVYLINSDNGGALGNELLLSASKLYGWNHFNRIEVRKQSIEKTILQSIVGNYLWNSEVELFITFSNETHQISLHFPNGDDYKLVPIMGENLEFIHPNTGIQISFSTKDDKQSFTLYGQKAIKQ